MTRNTPESGAGSAPPPTWSDLLGADAAAERELAERSPSPPQTRREVREREALAAGGRATAPPAAYGFTEDRLPRRKRRWIAAIVVPLLIIMVLVGGAATAAWLLFEPQVRQLMGWVEPIDYTGTGSGEAVVVIHEGDIGDDVARTLVRQDVVMSYAPFYELLLEEEPVFQPGAYRLAQKMSARAALESLLDPANKLENEVVVPEGEVLANVLVSIADANDISLKSLKKAAGDVGSYGLPKQAKTLEGFLFPATYQFDPGTSAKDALQTMVDRSFQALDEAGVAEKDRYETVTLASLVQKEAGLRDDYYRVSRVFLNRLDDGMLLQSDATVAYGTGNTHLVTTTDEERADESNDYNTYVHEGLPVGPISNPGDLAIDAALHPAKGDWYYFVTVNLDTGKTVFSETAEEHEVARNQWLEWMADHPEYG